MNDTVIDFEGNADVTPATTPAGNADVNPANTPDTTSLDGDGSNDITGKDNTNQGGENGTAQTTKEGETTTSTGELEPGTEIEFDGNVYTVDEKGNVVDKNGKLFKEAKDVEAWLNENAVTDSDDENDLSIDSIRELVGIDVTDEEGKSVEFTNDAQGVKSYIDSVIALKSNDIAQGAVNKVFTENPILKQFVDYLTVTGSPKGFGDIPDRSGIQLDKNNPSQLEAIVRMAAKEFGNKSLNDSYIKYLRDSGALYDEAKAQLEALVGKDKAYQKEIELKAQQAREQEEQEVRDYWQSVNDVINKKVIGGYKLPDSIVKEVNGQKVTYTTADFYRYLSEPAVQDENGNVLTAYQRDLNKLSNEESLNKELLDAWLTFTGGSYKDLIDMAVKENEVRKLIVKSKQQRTNRTVKINKAKSSKVDYNDILF